MTGTKPLSLHTWAPNDRHTRHKTSLQTFVFMATPSPITYLKFLGGGDLFSSSISFKERKRRVGGFLSLPVMLLNINVMFEGRMLSVSCSVLLFLV